MINTVLRRIEGTIADVVKGVKPKVVIKTPFFDFRLDLTGLTDLIADRDALAITIERGFTRRRLYTESLDRELIEFARKSAEEIRDELDEHADALSGPGGGHRPALHLLLEWAAGANRLVQLLRDRETELQEPTFVKDDQDSAESLLQFRRGTLPIVGVLITQIEYGTRVRAERAYDEAIRLLDARDVVSVSEAVHAE